MERPPPSTLDNAPLTPAWRKLLSTGISPPAVFPIGAKGASSTILPMRPPGEAKACNCGARRAPSWVEGRSEQAEAGSKGITRQTRASDQPRDSFRIERNPPGSGKETARELARVVVSPRGRMQDEMHRGRRPPTGARSKRS